MSYGCMTNIKQIIDGQNKGILAKQNVSNTPDAKSCNCRKPYDCPVAEKCLKESVIVLGCSIFEPTPIALLKLYKRYILSL